MNIHNVSKATLKRHSDGGWTTLKVVSKSPRVQVTDEGLQAISSELDINVWQIRKVLDMINFDHGFVEEEVTLFHDEEDGIPLEIS